MPHVSGLKGHAISGLMRDLPENEYGKANMHGCEEITAYNGIPDIGVIDAKELMQDELQPNYFVPNFIRPIPEAEEEPDLEEDPLSNDYDISQDVSIEFYPLIKFIRRSGYSLACFQSHIGTSTWSVSSSTMHR